MSHKANIHVVLDRSGSMEMIRDDAIGGFNTFLDETGGTGQKWYVWLFDTEGFDLIVDGKAAKNVERLSRSNYIPRSGTPLYDAVGKAIAKAEEVLVDHPCDRNVLAVLTDGQENSSREWTSQKVKDKMAELRDAGWQVVFIAVGEDAWDGTFAFSGFGYTMSVQDGNIAGGYSAMSGTVGTYLRTGSQTIADEKDTQ